MKKLAGFFIVMCLLLPPVFSPAQEAENASLPEETLEADTNEITEIIPVEAPEDRETPKQAEAETETAPKSEYDFHFFQRLMIAMGIIAAQILLIWFIWFLFRHVDHHLVESRKEKIKPITIHKLKLLTSKQVIGIIQAFLRILKYVITAIQLFLTLPFVFSLFPATEHLATAFFGYILDPLKDIGMGIIHYIPNLFKIIIIVLVTRYVLRGLKFFANQIERGKLVIPHFYTDWAAPTYKILQVLLWAFTVAIIYPYLPGSDSRAFQGVSVFVGIIFSLGSSTAIGNLVAGLVITYMRPFKIGDRVQIKEITGFVVEKNLMVVRLKTHKNEYVTFPNMMILGSSITNYTTSSDEDEEGLIIFAEITFGYSTPWQTVHDILIEAALATDHVQKRPKPFVLQTKLDDFYACYQINCYTKDVSKIPAIYTLLYENIQNGFSKAGLDMTAAHYRVITNGK